MAKSRATELYRRLGPVLFARAHRALKDEKLAEQLAREVTIELATLSNLSDADLLKRGRARMVELAKERGSSDVLDSLTPERPASSKSRPK